MSEKKLKVGGVVTFWPLARYTRRADLLTYLTQAGYNDYAPEARTPAAALRSALEEVFPSRTHRVEPLKDRSAFEIVLIDRGEKANVYAQMYRVAIDKDKAVELDPFDQDTAARIVRAFNNHLGLVTASAVTKLMTAVLYSLRGTRLRDEGAIYWLPDTALDNWRSLSSAVQAAATQGGRNRVHMIVHEMDADSVRAVSDAITTEVEQEAQRIFDEVVRIENPLGEKGLTSRRDQAEELRKKIELYEELLSRGLPRLRAAVDRADQAACNAVMKVAAGVVGAGA